MRSALTVALTALLTTLLLGSADGIFAAASPPDTPVPRRNAAATIPALHRCDIGTARPYRCGHIDVPSVRAEPAVGVQKIRFALRPRGEQRRPSLGTIIAVEGGPGFASTNFDSAKSFGAAFGPLLRRRELLLIDQRGTGASDPVLCGPLQRERVPELIASAECANQLGPRAAGFTSAESAADIESVRQALGLGRVILYGDSYGTLLAQAYAVRYGANLEGLVLSSAYPANDPFWRTLYPSGLRALRLQCDRDPDCHGDGAARFRRLLRRILHSGARTDDLLEFLLENGGTWAPVSYRHLNRAGAAFLRGNRRPLERLIEPDPPGQGDPGYFSAGMAEAVECNDYPVPWDRSAPYAQRVEQLDDAIAAFPDQRMFTPLTVREWMTQQGLDLVSCLAWPPPTGELDPPVPPGAAMPADLPTLVLAGEFDDITSVAEAREVAARFPSSQIFVVPNRGHASELYFPFKSPATKRIRRFVRAL